MVFKYFYRKHDIYINWGYHESGRVLIINGVRQCEIMPTLICSY